MQETRARSLGQEDPLKKEMATYSSILGNPMDTGAWRATVHRAAKSRTRLSNYACSPKRLALDKNIGEGNGTPLQHSCLENPMGGGA